MAQKQSLYRQMQGKADCIIKDGIRFVNNSMHAGYSIENSFKEALIQMEQVYGKDDDTYKGFKKL